MIKKLFNFLNKNFFLYILILPFLSVGLISGPAILGSWESLNYYYIFSQFNTPLDFRISPRANIGDPAFFFLEFSRILCDFFNFEPSISNFRYLSISYGIISLFLFFIISKRWFGISASLISSILLSVNPVFHFHQHSMTVLIVSFMLFLFFLERLQTLDYHYSSNWSWFGLSVSLALVFIHYGPGRIFSIILIGLWLFNFIYASKKYPRSKYIIKNIFLKLGLTFLISFILLVALDWRNLFSIIKFNEIIYPAGAETILGAFKSPTILNSFLLTFFLNGKVLLESITGLGKEYHSTLFTNMTSSFRYPLLNPILFLLLMAGIIISFIKLSKKNYFFSKPYVYCIILFLVCLFPLFFSAVNIINDSVKPDVGLSVHRMFYLLIPSYLLIAAFLNFIFAKIKNKKIYMLFISIVFFSFYVVSVNSLNKNYKNFDIKLNNVNYKISDFNLYEQWKDGTSYTNDWVERFVHNLRHAKYYNTAKKAKEKLDFNTNNKYYILNIDTKQFFEDQIVQHLRFNCYSVFFSIYLNSFGISSAWIQMIDLDKPEKVFLKFTLGKFSAPLIFKNDKMQYIKSPGFKGYFHYFSNNIPNVIIVTTAEELNFANNYLKKNNLSFVIIDI